MRELAERLLSDPLIGTTAAAKRLGIKAPNFRRDAVPHLTSIPVEGSADVYFKTEVERLAAEWEAKRAARAAANGERDVAV